MPIANPLQNAQIAGQIADLYGQIGAAKVWRKGFHKAGGVDFYSFADESESEDALREKLAAMRRSLRKIRSLGIAPPLNIKVYCTGKTIIGNIQMKNVAFQRGLSGARDPAIVLSPKVLDPAWAATLGGVCTNQQVHDGTPRGLCAAIVTHEIGHLLHELEDEDSFWGQMPGFPNGLSPNEIFNEVSLYAASNSKELVAEAFLGMVYGKRYSQPINDAYRALSGPAANVLL